MNIYVLSRDVAEAARYHVDRHVAKMIVESAQILCTVLYDTGVSAPYRPTHRHHPAVRWAQASLANWRWSRALALALNDEYRYRFRRPHDHRSAIVIRSLPEPDLPDRGLTPFAQIMPEPNRRDDPVAAYRAFYAAEKAHLARWTRRPVPEWWPTGGSAV